MESDKINMSLEDIIKSNRRSGKGGAARRGSKGAVDGASSGGLKGAGKVGAISRGIKGGRGGVRGATRGRASSGEAIRTGALKGKSPGGAGPRGGVRRRPAATPYARSTQVPDIWKHDLYEGDSRTRNGAVAPRGAPQPGSTAISRKNGGKTIIISNLDFGVTDSDITDLFGEFGTVKKSAVRYDKSGRSLGSAEVEYENSSSASQAMERYHNVPLDGKLMKITIVGGGGEEERPERTLASRLGAAPVPQPREMIRQPRGGYGDQGQLRYGYGSRGGGRGGRDGGSGRDVSIGKGKRAGGGRGGQVAAGGSSQGTGGGRGAGGKSGRGAGVNGGFEGRSGPRRGRSGANSARKVASKEDLDAQLDVYKMETD